MATEKVFLEVVGDFKDATRDLRSFASRGDKSLKRVESSFKKVNLAAASFLGNLGARAAVGAFRAIGQAVSGLARVFISDGIKAAQVQEDAINKLNVALAASGKLVPGASESFQEFASSLQQVTRFGDEVILENAAILQSLGGLEQEGLQRATKAALDLSSALGIELNAATILVGKAATGEVSSFSRYGLIIKKAGTEAETFENALTALETKFGGAAQAQVKTFSGANEQLGNTFGDLQEEIGFTFTQSEAFVDIIKAVNQALLDAQKFVKENRDSIRSLVVDGVLFAINGFGSLLKAIDFIQTGFQGLKAGINIIISTFAELARHVLFAARVITETAALTGVELFEDANQSIIDLQDNLQLFADEAEAQAKREIDTAAERSAAIQGIIDKTKEFSASVRELGKNQSEVVQIQNTAIQKVNELSAAQKKLQASATKALEAIGDQNIGTKLEQTLAKVKTALDQGLVDRKKFEDEIKTLEEQVSTERETKRLETLEKEITDLRERNQLLTDIDAEKNATLIMANEDRINSIAMMEDENSKIRLKVQAENAKKAAEAQKKIDSQRLADQQTFLSTASTLAQSENQTLATIGKAAAITQIAIQTPPAVAASFRFGASIGGPPLGFAFAGIAAAAQAAQAARVAGIALQTGLTEVPGGFPNDTFPARLTSGERVISTEQNRDLKDFIGGNDKTNELLMSVLGAIQSQQMQTVVNIGDDEIVNVINRAAREGRVLTA